MIAVTVSILQGIIFLLSCGRMWQCISCVFEIQIFVVLFFLSLRAMNFDVHIINDVIKSIHKLYFEWHSHHFLSIQT